MCDASEMLLYSTSPFIEKVPFFYVVKHSISLIGEFQGHQLNIETREWKGKTLRFVFPKVEYIKERNLQYNAAASVILEKQVYGICMVVTFSNDREFEEYRSYVNERIAWHKSFCPCIENKQSPSQGEEKSLD
jgi:hypothetical protein